MIGKVSRGSSAGGLLRYLYGPGRSNEHENAHLVAPHALTAGRRGREHRPGPHQQRPEVPQGELSDGEDVGGG